MPRRDIIRPCELCGRRSRPGFRLCADCAPPPAEAGPDWTLITLALACAITLALLLRLISMIGE